jgi:hypothetical protein
MIGYHNDKVSVLVANVLNGPDTVVNDKWTGVLTQAAAAKEKVIGYVRTGYLGLALTDPGPFEPFETRLGTRDIADWIAQIERDVDLWYKQALILDLSFFGQLLVLTQFRLYGEDKIGGIFFDEGWNECGENNKYARGVSLYQRKYQAEVSWSFYCAQSRNWSQTMLRE